VTASSRDQFLHLVDWRRRVFSLYDEVRAAPEPEAGWAAWRDGRDDLFAAHPQSPLTTEGRAAFEKIDYFPYRPDARVTASVVEAEAAHYDIATSGSSSFGFTRWATAGFELEGTELALELYWFDGYGGGLFVPFRDLTRGHQTYGAGRYLLDTVKGADLGTVDDKLVLDFNFAYNPSCAYDPKWVCPLAPPPNRLAVAIEAGEKDPAKTSGAPAEQTDIDAATR